MAKKQTKQLPHLRIRLEPELLAKLEKSREKEGRTLTGEIERRLAQSFETDDRMAILKESMEARLADAMQRVKESRAWAEKEREEIRAEEEKFHAEVEELRASLRELRSKHEADYRELENEIELARRGEAVVDVLLGKNKDKSELLRLLALKLADMPEDWVTNEEARRQVSKSVGEEFSQSLKRRGTQ
jgi:hypothetical protein